MSFSYYMAIYGIFYQILLNFWAMVIFRKSYYAMSFDFKFEYGGDDVYVAYTIPYTYT